MISLYISRHWPRNLRLSNTKKLFVGTQFWDSAYRIPSNFCLHLKTSLAVSTPLTNTIINLCTCSLGHTSKLWHSLFFLKQDHTYYNICAWIPDSVASCSWPEKYQLEERIEKHKRRGKNKLLKTCNRSHFL